MWRPTWPNDLRMYYVTLVIVSAAYLLIMRIVHSPFGQVLKGIKENEPRVVSLGYDTDRFKPYFPQVGEVICA